MTLTSQVKQFARFGVEGIKIETENATLGKRVALGFSGFVMLIAGCGSGWLGLELQRASDLFAKIIGVMWIGVFVSMVLFGGAFLCIALYPILRWVRKNFFIHTERAEAKRFSVIVAIVLVVIGWWVWTRTITACDSALFSLGCVGFMALATVHAFASLGLLVFTIFFACGLTPLETDDES